MMNMVRCLMKEKNLSRSFLGEAVLTFVYLLNRCPTKSIEGAVPLEIWSGVKPAVGHLRVFGSFVYSHVVAQKRCKLDDKGEPMVLMGYHNTGTYKLYDL